MPPRPWLRWATGPCSSLTRWGAHHTGELPADPHRRWRNVYMDDIDHAALAEPAAGWEITDNYNASHPFNTIDQLHIAIPGDARTAAS